MEDAMDRGGPASKGRVATPPRPDSRAQRAGVCDGTHVLAALRASAAWLEVHRASVDALNVFPVPDGDTGTNMALTLGAALRQAETSAPPTVGTVAEGAARYLHGLPVSADQPAVTDAALQMAHVAHGDDYGYCTEFAVVGPDLDLAMIRDAVAQLGESTLVVGDEGLVHIHVHTEDPGRVLSYAAPLGQLHQVKIESMQEQHDRFVAQAGAAASRTANGAPPGAVEAARPPPVPPPP